MGRRCPVGETIAPGRTLAECEIPKLPQAANNKCSPTHRKQSFLIRSEKMTEEKRKIEKAGESNNSSAFV